MPPILRSIFGIMAGFIVMSVVVMILTMVAVVTLHLKSGHPTPGYLAFNVAYSFLAAAAGGAVAALVAGRRYVLHGAVLGGIMLVAGVFSYMHYTGSQPLWYQWLMIVAPPLCAVAGAAVAARSVPAERLPRL